VVTESDDGTKLSALGFWPADAVQRLQASWITTAEQVVGISATADGISALAQQTNLQESVLRALIERTAQRLPERIRRSLSKPADVSQFGRGAVRPFDTDK
jgi:hypothetical protein